MPATADVGQSVVAAILGLGAAGVAGGIVAMAWSVHVRQIQLAERLAKKDASGSADVLKPAHILNGNGAAAKRADGTANGHANGHAIEGPDSVLIGEQVRYRVRRSESQRVVAWAAGGGAVSQAADPAHPDDLLLVAAQPGTLTVSVRLREGIAERRETKAVTAVASPPAAPAATSRLFLQDWPLTAVVVVVIGFAAALVALGSLQVGGFIALVAPLAAMLVVVTAARRQQERPGQSPPPL